MRISFVEIQNFRKLKSVRVDFSNEMTLFVGANNSGKTSAMLALSRFLVNPNGFTTNDFTLSNWAVIEKLGTEWEQREDAVHTDLTSWEAILPSLDVWLDISADEIHYVRLLLPKLDWTGGLLGVRLRFEPKELDKLYKEFLIARKAAIQTIQSGKDKEGNKKEYAIKLWPQGLRDFLDRKLRGHFTVRAYSLDPSKCATPSNGNAKPQLLPKDAEPIDGNPLNGLIRIDEIAAQRGLGESTDTRADVSNPGGYSTREGRKLSDQLRSYYSKHLDPSEDPEPADLDALEAIETSQKQFDERLVSGFSAAIQELESLNYPGVTDPKLKIATRIRPIDGLDHSTAVQYEVLAEDGKALTSSLRLPEDYNGLGYQNLISIVFMLMSFRDAWMRVGKANKVVPVDSNIPYFRPPLHLILVEEPEAHLHPQVQQVFVRKAYEILRNHEDLGNKPTLQTQLILSTHSSHVAHECQFNYLRYFRRLPAVGSGNVPTSVVINLSEVFGANDETSKFVSRYLKATHCDLFFADAAIFVEGAAERILIPHFIKNGFVKLNRSYVTLLEIGGSHAHRLRPLIEHLGLTTLIITDLDSVESTGRQKATPPVRGCNQLSGNATLKSWHPKLNQLDALIDLPACDKEMSGNMPLFSIRVAYQTPIKVKIAQGDNEKEALARTFEDALVFENLGLFKTLTDITLSDLGTLIRSFKNALNTKQIEVGTLSAELFKALEKGDKAEFALDLLYLGDALLKLKIPAYVHEGLVWIEKQLEANQPNILPPEGLEGISGASQ